MKIIVTGSLGHIGKPLTKELVEKKHAVTVISSNPQKQQTIEALGAIAAIGSLEDADFLANTFSGGDAVFTMVPPNDYFNHDLDLLAYFRSIGNNYATAIRKAGIKRVVNLSTIGAHLEKGSGILLGAHDVENILNALPSDVVITHARPTAFFYNLNGYMATIKKRGCILTNYGAADTIAWVAPADIAAVVAEELLTPAATRKIRYVVSDERTGNETARILGAAIGKPDLKWVLISDEEARQGLEEIGMAPQIAAGLCEMYSSLHTGLLSEDYDRNKPAVMGKVKLEDFAIEFATLFNNN